MKVADIRLGWTKSPSADVKAVKIVVTIDGNPVVTTDNEGLQSVSETYSFTLGDLTAPAPATNLFHDLFHDIVSIRDVEG